MSGYHNQSLDRALGIVDAVAKTGVHALKIQTYTPKTMTLDLDEREFHISDPNSLWVGNSLYKLYGEAHTPWRWHKPIFDRARELGIIAFSTPFDETAVDLLESLEVPCYKIASFENTDLPLIRRVAATGKPMIISTGMASIAELDDTVRAVRQAGGKDLILLKCTSTYPATADNTNILTIPHMRELFQCEVGLSDHTMGCGAATAAIAHGATLIEKHFTLDKLLEGPDHILSADPQEMKTIVSNRNEVFLGLGDGIKRPTPIEYKQINSQRKAIFTRRKIKKGEVLSLDNISIKGPGHGLLPKYLPVVLGKKVTEDIDNDLPITWDVLLSN